MTMDDKSKTEINREKNNSQSTIYYEVYNDSKLQSCKQFYTILVYLSFAMGLCSESITKSKILKSKTFNTPKLLNITD